MPVTFSRPVHTHHTMTNQYIVSNPATSLDFTGVSPPLQDALGLIRSVLILAPNQQASYIWLTLDCCQGIAHVRANGPVPPMLTGILGG